MDLKFENLIDEGHNWLTTIRAHMHQGNHALAKACVKELTDTLADINKAIPES